MLSGLWVLEWRGYEIEAFRSESNWDRRSGEPMLKLDPQSLAYAEKTFSLFSRQAVDYRGDILTGDALVLF